MDDSKWYASSAGDGVSLTLKGVVTALVPVIIGVLKHYNVQVTENEIADVINAAFTAASAFMVVYGLGRKTYYRFIRR